TCQVQVSSGAVRTISGLTQAVSIAARASKQIALTILAERLSPAAVDADCLSSDGRGLVGGKKRYYRSHLLRPAGAADRVRVGALGEADLQIVAILAPVRADRARGADRTRANGIHRDPVRCQIKRQ